MTSSRYILLLFVYSKVKEVPARGQGCPEGHNMLSADWHLALVLSVPRSTSSQLASPPGWAGAEEDTFEYDDHIPECDGGNDEEKGKTDWNSLTSLR
jgi:hypothetical protein